VSREAYWEEKERMRKMYRHPAASHIPGPQCTNPELRTSENHDVPGTSSGFPWLALGYRVLLVMLKNEERISDGGIILPDVHQSAGKDKAVTQGIVIGYGPGQIVFGQYVSPYWDYGIETTDVVFIEPNVGIPIALEEKPFRVIAPHDIIMRLNRTMGAETRKRIVGLAQSAIDVLHKHQDRAGLVAKADLPGPRPTPGYIEEAEDVKERILTAAGKATKTQILVPGKK